MSEKKKAALPKVIKVILDILYGTMLFVILGLMIWIAISPALINRTGISITASIPVTLGQSEKDKLDLEFEDEPGLKIHSGWIDEARGTLRLETGSSWLLLLSNGSKLVLAIGLAYIFYLLRKVLRSILEGAPFQERNSQLIRRLGYAFLVVGFGFSVLEGLAAQAILKRLPETIPALHATTRFDLRVILGAALLIFLLSQIWTYGLELERDRALTV